MEGTGEPWPSGPRRLGASGRAPCCGRAWRRSRRLGALAADQQAHARSGAGSGARCARAWVTRRSASDLPNVRRRRLPALGLPRRTGGPPEREQRYEGRLQAATRRGHGSGGHAHGRSRRGAASPARCTGPAACWNSGSTRTARTTNRSSPGRGVSCSTAPAAGVRRSRHGPPGRWASNASRISAAASRLGMTRAVQLRRCPQKPRRHKTSQTRIKNGNPLSAE